MTTILKALENWKDRVEKLRSKHEANQVLVNEVVEIEKDIFRVYQILFKNLTSKRIDTTISFKENHSSCLCLNKEGISYLPSYGNNSYYVDSFDRLVSSLSGNNYELLLEYLNKPLKKKLLRIFGRELNKIKESKVEIRLELSKEIKLKSIKKDMGDIVNWISYKKNTISFHEDVSYYSDISFCFKNLKTKDYVVIEQTYKEVNQILDKSKKKMICMRKERDKVLKTIRSHFSAELILEELKIDN